MPYRYLDDIAGGDVAFEAEGKNLEELFVAAGNATTNVMVEDLASVKKDQQLSFDIEKPELDLLLFRFLNELIFLKDARRLLLRPETVAIKKKDSTYFLHATVSGEKLDPEKHNLVVDVKAVTLHRFALKQTQNGWTATVVLDV